MMANPLKRGIEKIERYLLRNHFTIAGFELQLECWWPVKTKTEGELEREQNRIGISHNGQTSGTRAFQVLEHYKNKDRRFYRKKKQLIKKIKSAHAMHFHSFPLNFPQDIVFLVANSVTLLEVTKPEIN